MLYLSRKIGESIIINNSIELTVIEVRGKTVKIGFDFPPDATVLRKEIYEKIMAENMAAAKSGMDIEGDFAEVEFDMSAFDELGKK
ncbi:MAG: carbon storage regulator CsrA [Rickettsiales bacterium]